MELNEILNELNILFKKELTDDSISLQLESTAKDVDNWDSLNHMVLISAIEKKYHIKFSLKEIMKLKNVGDMCSLVQSKINK